MRGRSVFLVENSPLFQAAIVSILRRLGFSIGTFDPAQEPVQAGARRGKQADLFLVDVVTFSGSLKDLEEAIKRYSRVGPVLLLAREDHIEQVVAGLKAGAVGFVKQTASLSELRNAIKALASGNTFCDRRLFQRIMKYLPVVASSGRPSLTKREEEVLSLVSVAQTNKERLMTDFCENSFQQGKASGLPCVQYTGR